MSISLNEFRPIIYFEKGKYDNKSAIPILKPRVNKTISAKNISGTSTNEARPLDKYEFISG
ncbi:hypothetical protein AST07_02285 [Staphylococcus saprophyticus]|nr:hypothetical protein AST06_11200 [Staphylococcus saprophyticus]OEK93461.1 hypothetical protein AST07_02285 [Staphylococcus saprophyticus]